MASPSASLSAATMKFGSVAWAVFCCTVMLDVTAVPAREVSGIRMPEIVSVGGVELRLNGMGLFKQKIFVKIYVIGLYLEEPTADAGTAVTADEAKRIVFVMLRDIGRETFVEAVETAIMRNSRSAMPTLRARLDLLEQALPALKKGNTVDLTYLPGVGTLVRGQGREMTIPGKDFADALFSAWLGSEPVDARLKRKLLGDSS
jgi:hypothetical protein